MRTLVAAHTFVLGLLLLATSSHAKDASATLPWDVPRLPQLPFLSSAQSIISYFRPAQIIPTTKSMKLRSVYHQGTRSYRNLSARYDYSPLDSSVNTQQNDISAASTITMKTTKVKTWKPKDNSAFLHAHRQGDDVGVRMASQGIDWDELEVDAPDVTDRETLLALSMMASKAYDAPTNSSGSDWTTGGGKWNLSESFGWVEDGIRGHIFATEDNATIVVALKGTSAALLDDGSTSKRDKENDNLLFSCCCAHVGWTWRTVCDCYGDKVKGKAISPSLGTMDSQQQCASSCLSKAIIKKSFYYPATTDLFNNISYAYPDSQIWITGHSLGGALGALIGMTFGYPTVTFEAPAERMAAVRLHLPLPVKHDNMDALPITHVYHTADPIPNGECVGATSLCAISGFAMESKCHSGKTVLYDTVGKLGWSSSITTHRIATLTDDLLREDWDKRVSKAGKKSTADAGEQKRQSWLSRWHLPWSNSGDEDKEGEEKLGSVPKLTNERKCRDCLDWNFSDDDDNLTQGV